MSRRSSFRVLIVDDFGPWRRLTATMLQKRPELRVIDEASDGLEAVQKTQALQPDLVLLDIGLPLLNGIEAARRIREVSPDCKILFVSDNRSADIAEEALSTGAYGYIVKSDAASELMPAVNAVLGGKHFVSASLSGNNLAEAIHLQTGAHPQRNNVVMFTPPQTRTRNHNVIFYSSDRDFLEGVTRFIGAALKAGDAAIVVATDSHRDKLFPRLHAYGVDMDAAIKRGRYITVDADTIFSFVVNGTFDTSRFLDTLCNLILVAAKAAEREHPRVVIFGEGAHLLWVQGSVEAAIEDERLCNQLVKMYDVDILCGYGLNVLPGGMEPQIYRQICEEHSAVYSR